MDPGRFDCEATFERRVGAKDAHGNAADTWAFVGESWASIEDSGGRELYRTQQVQPQVTALIEVRERIDDLVPADRASLIDARGIERVFEIASILGVSDRSGIGMTLAAIEQK